jgi:hypothetical protein
LRALRLGAKSFFRCTAFLFPPRAGEDLDFLLGLPESARQTRITGTVLRAEPFQSVNEVKVVIAGAAKKIEVFTNSEGLFQATGLPAGNYKVWAVLPDNRITIDRQITLPVGGCATLGIVAKGKSN